MPSRSVARMMTSPLRALIATPLTSMLTSSSPMDTSGSLRLRADDAASAVLDHVFELVTKVLQEALHGPGGRIAEPADGMAFDAIGHVEQQAHILHARLAVEDAIEGTVQPARALAAGRALPAGLRHVEARQALESAHHAGGFIHDDDGCRADARARGLDRVVVHIGLEHDLRRHHRHRGAAR